LLIGNDKLFKACDKEELLNKVIKELSKQQSYQQDPQGACEELIKSVAEKTEKKDELGAILVTFNFDITSSDKKSYFEKKKIKD